MIQRIQTVYLFIIAIILILAAFLPIWKNKGFYTKDGKEGFLTLHSTATTFSTNVGDGAPVSDEKTNPPSPTAGNYVVSNNYHIAALLILCAITALFTIFQFKKRMLQIKLCSFIYLLLSAILVCYYLAIKSNNSLLSEADKGDFLIGFYMPVLGIIFNFLAIRFIRKDEALVRSVDRLR